MSHRPNIAVVVLDTLRNDSFHSYFDWVPGRTFTRAYSTSHWTVPAHGSLFTGFYPSEIGVHSRSQILDCEESTIAEDLSNAGYHTTKYSANLNISAWEGWNRGFDHSQGPDDLKSFYDVDTVQFTEFKSQSSLSGIRLYLSAVLECFRSEHSTVYSLLDGIRTVLSSEKRGSGKSVLQRIKSNDFADRNFLFINLMESHVPYYPPSEYRRVDHPVGTNSWEPFLNGVSNLDEIKLAYEDSVQYLSNIYKSIFSELQEDFDYIITLSDHGEMLGEFGMVDHIYGLYPQLTRVPVTISGSGITDTVIDTPVSILDVHASIADLADISVKSRGQSLLEEVSPKNRLVEYNGFPPWLKDTFSKNGIDQTTYSQLNQPLHGFIGKDGIYSFETHDGDLLAEGEAEINEQDRRRQLDELVSELDKCETDRKQTDTPDAVLSHLEDLGYA